MLDVTLDDAVVDMVAGGYDPAIRIGEVLERYMIAVPLGPELRQVVVTAPDYLARFGRPESPHDLPAIAASVGAGRDTRHPIIGSSGKTGSGSRSR